MQMSIGSTILMLMRSGYRAASAFGPSSQNRRMTRVRTTVSIASAMFNASGLETNRETMTAETVAAPILAKLFPRSRVASSFSGDSSHIISFCAGLLPWDARWRTVYLLLAKMAVSEREKNADKSKKASRGRIKIVSIKERVFPLGHWNLAARFRNGFFDSILKIQFRLI